MRKVNRYKMIKNTSSLKERYEREVKTIIARDLAIKNKMAIPKITKITVNMGVGEIAKNKESLEKTIFELAAMTGQKPSVRQAKISVAGFNLRRGMPVGLAVNLRGDRAYNFLDKLIRIVLPRIRDFRGIPTKSFDKNGNYTLGITEHTVFPEVNIVKVDKPKGLEITIVLNTGDSEKSLRLLTLLGMPFEKK